MPQEDLLATAAGVRFVAFSDADLARLKREDIDQAMRDASLDLLPPSLERFCAFLLRFRQFGYKFFRALEVSLLRLRKPSRPTSASAAKADAAMSGAPAKKSAAQKLRFDPFGAIGGYLRRISIAHLGWWKQAHPDRESPIQPSDYENQTTIDLMFFCLLYLTRSIRHAQFAASVLNHVESELKAGIPAPGIVHAHDTHSIVAGDSVATALGAKFVYDAVEISGHQFRLNGRMAKWTSPVDVVYRRLERLIAARADRMTTIGESLADWFQQNYTVKSAVVPIRNTRDYEPPQRDMRIRQDCGLDANVPLLFWCGNASAHRGLELIIDLLPHVPEFHAVFVTEFKESWEEYRQSLIQRIADNGVGDRVHIVPMRPPNDVVAYASGADIGVVAGAKDSPLNILYCLPNKFHEMVMARLPIAATHLVNIQMLIREHGNGCEIDEDRFDEAAAMLRDLIARRRDGTLDAKLESAARALSWQNDGARLVEVYNSITSDIRSERASAVTLSSG
ncbi:MAG TPA: glycosyltransferase family 4 protein [Rhizobiaceae bacterium]|nr:glycosyltransferase family 4 protein [Rhizobiaceae bacterium]